VSPYILNRFSERLFWSTPQNAYSLRLAEMRTLGIPLLDLTTANPTETFLDYPHQAIANAFGAIPSFRYEPAALGSTLARETIAAWYAAQEIPAQADRLALTASTSEAYSILFKLLCDPHDEVLVPFPSYPLFEYLARLESVTTRPYPLNYDGGWFIDFTSLQKSLSARTKAIVVVNPNNPTGSFLKIEEVRQLISIAEQHRLAIISDEVFMTYPSAHLQPRQVPTLLGHNEVLSFSLNGLSKAAGMPQMKLGWIAVNGPPPEVTSALAKLDLILDSYLSVGTPIQCALPSLLKIGDSIHRQIESRLHQNRQTLASLRGTSVEALASEGGWSVILQLPSVHSEDDWIAKLLADEKIIVQPGYFYDMVKEAFVVVSLISEPASFAEGIERLSRLVARA
jgi:hypothetical protein